MIFDSSVAVGQAEAVYLSARARQVPYEQLDGVLDEASAAGAAPAPSRATSSPATATSCEVLDRGGEPRYGRGTDTRMPADPRARPTG